MTTPRLATSRGSVRTYPWPPTPPYEFENISVTSAISGGLPKPFLLPWVAKVTAEDAIRKHAAIGALLESGDEKAAVDLLKGARYRDMGTKADRGTIVHAALEAHIAGKPLSDDTLMEMLTEARVPQAMWRSAHKMIGALMQFLADEEPEIFWSESTIYSRTHHYAGTADLIARMKVGDSRVPVIVDVKTSKRVYDETALQLCAYARADFVGLNDGTEMPLIPAQDEGDMNAFGEATKVIPKIEYGVVVRPMASGRYEKVVFALTDEVYELFLACLAVATKQGALQGARRP